MTFNRRVDRIESGPNNPKAPNNEVVWIDTDNNTISRYDEGSSEWVSVGGTAGTFDDPILKDNVRFTDNNDSVRLRVEHGGTGVVRLHAPEDDLALRSANDILLYAGDDGPGNVYIGWGDATYTPDANNRVATIGDIENANTADFIFTDNEWNSSITLPGDKSIIIEAGVDSDLRLNAGDDLTLTANGDDITIQAADDIRFTANYSDETGLEYYWRMDSEGRFQLPGDGYIENIINAPEVNDGNDSLKLVPDDSLISNTGHEDQYLLIEPTAPNHIHIRAGGVKDASTADLIIGGEETSLLVSDTGHYLDVKTTSESNTYVWRFNSDGYLTGPAMGGLFVSGIVNGDNDLWLSSGSNVVISSGEGMGVFLENQDAPGNQVATINDLNTSKGTHSRVLASDGSPLTGALVHVGKLLYANLTETAASFIIPTNASVAFPIGSEIKFATSDESSWNISAEDYATTTVWGEGSNYTWSNQTFIVPTNSTATLLKVDTDRWILSSLRLTD